MGCSSSVETQLSEGNFHDRYYLGKKLGQGSFGQVRVAVSRTAQQSSFVVKILDIRKHNGTSVAEGKQALFSIDRERSEDARVECEIWRKIGKSTYCVELFEVFAGAGMVYIVMETCECSLLDKLEDMLHWTEFQMRAIFREMLLGIEHCHRLGIAHRDLKPDNYLYGLDGTVKLADFGLAAVMPRTSPLSGTGALRGLVGTVPYMSPEMLGQKKYDLKTDIWSYGVCVYFMLFAEYPYGPQAKSFDEMKAAILKGRTPSFARSPELLKAMAQTVPGAQVEEQGMSSDLTGFIKNLLVREPKIRPTAEKALDHEFLDVVVSVPSDQWAMWGSEASTCSFELKPLVALARARSLDFVSVTKKRSKKDPTVETDLDTLLKALQQEHGAAGADMRRSFSLPIDKNGGGFVMALPPLPEESEEHSIADVRAALLDRGNRSGSSLMGIRRSSTYGGETNPNTPATTLDELPVLSLESLPALTLAPDCDGWSEGDWSYDLEDDDESLLPPPVPRLPRCHSTVAVGGSSASSPCTSTVGLEDADCSRR